MSELADRPLRLLFTIQPAWSHLNTVAPLAYALTRRGHEVAIASSASMRSAIAARGLVPAVAGVDWEASRADSYFPGFLRSRVRRQAKHLLALAGRGMVEDLVELTARWRPDVIIRDSTEFGGMLLGSLQGTPVVVMGIGVRPPLEVLTDVLAAGISNLRARYGLPAPTGVEDITGALWISSFPRSFAWASADIQNERHVRAVIADGSDVAQRPPWLSNIAEPAVYVTLGTVVNQKPDFLRMLATSLASEMAVVVTTGRNVNPESLGRLPANVHVAEYVPQTMLAPHVRAVVSHGGFNTVLGALAEGLPVCCIPLAMDHPPTASRCVALGVGTSVTTWTPLGGFAMANPEHVTPAAVIDAVLPLLYDEAIHQRVKFLQQEIGDLPGPEIATRWIEELADAS